MSQVKKQNGRGFWKEGRKEGRKRNRQINQPNPRARSQVPGRWPGTIQWFLLQANIQESFKWLGVPSFGKPSLTPRQGQVPLWVYQSQLCPLWVVSIL